MKTPFFGGTHPAPKKELCEALPVALKAPERVYIPLKQHIGAPCEALVSVGDTVRMGQKIGDGKGLCVPVHASVSGTVEEIAPHKTAAGELLTVVIRNDFKDTPEDMIATPDEAQITAQGLLDCVREAGIVGMGGATFPTDAKIKSALESTDTLIVNACECEPYITADDVLLQEHAAEVIRGLRAVMQVLQPARAVIAMEDNKKKAAESVRAALKDAEDIELRILPTRYPQGAEKQLIQAVTGREVKSGGLPMDVGCAVFNASTLYAVYRALYEGRALFERIVTVTGEGVREPKNLIVRIGTPFSDLIEACGGLTEQAWKVIAGGPMMGVAVEALAVPLTKGSNAVLVLSDAQNGEDAHPTCIRCARCVEACPVRLEPLYFHLYTQGRQVEQLKRIHVNDCIECGCCAYVCPGKLPLVESIRTGKRYVKEGIPA